MTIKPTHCMRGSDIVQDLPSLMKYVPKDSHVGAPGRGQKSSPGVAVQAAKQQHHKTAAEVVPGTRR